MFGRDYKTIRKHINNALKEELDNSVVAKFATTANDGKTLTRDDIELNINYKGNVVCERTIINKDGSIYVGECTVDGTKVDYEYGKTEYGMIKERDDKITGGGYGKAFDTEIYGSRVSKFAIYTQLEIPNKEEYESKDYSYDQDGSIMLYWKVDYEENDTQYYEMILAGDGEIYTPYDSTGLFANIGYQRNNFKFNLTGVNTSKTTNMSHMFDGGFYCLALFDLGENFDTSNVTNMSWMFNDLGASSSQFTQLDLGDQFVINDDTNISDLFNNCGSDGILTQVIVPNVTLKTKIESLNSPNDVPQFWKDNNIIEVKS